MADIRPYRPGDLDDLYRICLATGDAGADATHLYVDPRIIGHVFAAPYAILCPELAFVIEDEEGVAGYVLGALDTAAFETAAEERWWPSLRERYADPGLPAQADWGRDDLMACAIHHPQRTPRRLAEPFPSHLHIDLLPRLQGRGFGTRMLDLWFERVAQMGSRGAHLGVGAANVKAIRFYRAYGLVEPASSRPPPEGVLWFVKALPGP